MRMLSVVLTAVLLVVTGLAPAAAAPPAAEPAPDSAHATVTAQDVRELVERVLDAYGGRAALDRVKAYRAEGRVVAVMQGREGPTTRLFQRPNRLRIELRYAVEPELRIVAGARGWRGSEDGVEPASGPMLDAMILQAARAAVPWILMEHAAEARRIEPREHRGRQLVGLEIPLGGGMTLRLWIDPSTRRVEVSQGTLAHHGMGTAFETAYGDFRMVDGVLFAFREENYASGAHTGYTAIERVVLNPKPRPGDFAPPREKGSDS